MKRILIYLSLVLLLSCNTTKRAEKRIYNIVENHQELLKQDTVKIDTTFVITRDDDSVTFMMEEITEKPKIIRSETGNFVITRLPSKEVKINYLPDTMEVNYRDSIVYDKIVIQEPPQKWRDVLFACIIAFIGLLFLKMFFERILRG